MDFLERCATCGRDIEAGQAYSRVTFEGKPYVFCCETCESAFEASSFQRQLIPESFENAFLSVFIEYLPALRVGGDYAHARFLRDELFYLFVGDVSGHGVTASLLMSRVSAEVERLAGAEVELVEIVVNLDDLIRRVAGTKTLYLTLFSSLANLRTGTLSFVNCGHPAPLLWSDHSKRPLELESQAVPVGLFDLAGTRPRPERIPIVEGSRLVLFTDGLTDGLSELETETGVELGESGIEAMVRDFIARPSAESAQQVFDRVRKLPKPEDDILLALVEFKKSRP
ncbi:MAG: SpoIIE family protein phosphatase [Acidobacteriota bacterium]